MQEKKLVIFATLPFLTPQNLATKKALKLRHNLRFLEYHIPNLRHFQENQEIVVMTIKVLDWGGNQQFPIENALSVHKSVENVHFL